MITIRAEIAPGHPVTTGRRHGAVARHEIGFAAQGPKPCGDRMNQIIKITAREIGAPYRSLEQHIANHRDARRRMVEDDMAGRMAGAMIDIERQITDRHRIAIDQPAIRLKALRVHAPARAVFIQLINPEPVVLVRAFDL